METVDKNRDVAQTRSKEQYTVKLPNVTRYCTWSLDAFRPYFRDLRLSPANDIE